MGVFIMSLITCIADNFDDAMLPYTNSSEFKSLKAASDAAVDEFIATLSPADRSRFENVCNLITDTNAALCEKAYVTGVVNGIALAREIG